MCARNLKLQFREQKLEALNESNAFLYMSMQIDTMGRPLRGIKSDFRKKNYF